MEVQANRLALHNLTCKKCLREFLTNVKILWENKGNVTCANCGESSHYVPTDLKKGFNSGS